MVIQSAWGLVLVTLGAAFLPSVGRWVRLPSVVLEILFGVILGKSLLNIEFSGEWLPFLAHLGFLILMFHAGMEINFTALRRQSTRIYTVQAAVFTATVGLSLAAAFLIGQGFYLALVLSTTSLGLVVPALRQAETSQSQMGQSALIAATLADFLTLFIITFFVVWYEKGFGWEFLRPLPFFIGFGILLKMVQFLAWWYPEKMHRLLGDDDSQEMGVRFSLALLFLFVALSNLSDMEPVLGAFIGGAMVSFVFREKTQLEQKLSGFGYGFLIPIFFIHVGMQFDIANVFFSGQVSVYTATPGICSPGKGGAEPAVYGKRPFLHEISDSWIPDDITPQPDYCSRHHRPRIWVYHGLIQGYNHSAGRYYLLSRAKPFQGAAPA